jgi:hypothetical protein
VIAADAAAVQHVVVGGAPIYGARGLMAPFWAQDDLETIVLPSGPKALASPAAGIAVSAVAMRLTTVLLAEGATLAPLTEAVTR